MMDWIWQNREWIFSGVGAALIGVLLGWMKRKRDTSGTVQSQHSGRNSTNIQAGRDVNIGGKHGR
jgi:hypothetical protein